VGTGKKNIKERENDAQGKSTNEGRGLAPKQPKKSKQTKGCKKHQAIISRGGEKEWDTKEKE